MRPSPQSNGADYPTIRLLLSPDDADKWITLLQSGIDVQLTAGESLMSVLERLPGFTRNYIADEVQTIFLDGTALDDVETPLVDESAVIALSAAMPGLSGAIFRRNSIHANLRSVQHDRCNSVEPRQISVQLKLFNAIARDRGPQLLGQGVVIKTKKLLSFLNTHPWLVDRLRSIAIAGNTVENTTALFEALEKGGRCFFIADVGEAA